MVNLRGNLSSSVPRSRRLRAGLHSRVSPRPHPWAAEGRTVGRGLARERGRGRRRRLRRRRRSAGSER
eukprot:967169-Pyramimonas_sp.AAC.1